MWVALVMSRMATLEIGVDLDLAWAEGQIGALPIFDSREAAESWASAHENCGIVPRVVMVAPLEEAHHEEA